MDRRPSSAFLQLSFAEGIYIARQNGDLLKEETLYRRLIKVTHVHSARSVHTLAQIYRTPELLVKLSQRVDPEDQARLEQERLRRYGYNASA